MRWSPRRVVHTLPYLGLLLAAGLSFVFVPAGQALWARVLGITGTVNTGEFEPPGFEGCTPGTWRNPERRPWPPPFDPDDKFSDVFGHVITIELIRTKETVTDPTLLQAINARGGGVGSLAKQSVAALLNAAHEDVNYPFSVEEIIQMVREALDGGDVEGTRDILAAANKLGCPLSGSGDEDDEDEDTDESDSTPAPGPEPTSTPTPESDRSCSAAFWGNAINLEFWPASLSPDALASEVFEVEIPDSPTLFEALSLEGDGVESLIREATAALLNALSPDIEFEKSADEIVELFEVAYGSGDPALVAETLAELEKLNNGECSGLGKGEVDGETPPEVETPDPTATPTP